MNAADHSADRNSADDSTADDSADRPHSVKWAARLPHVRDVTLFGAADLKYWQARLKSAGLMPVDDKGRARIMIVGADSRFLGIRFQEVSVSVAVVPSRAFMARDAVCLRQAYNSVRFFAFCERRLFHTPYVHGAIRVGIDQDNVLARLELRSQQRVVLHAELAGTGPDSSRTPSTTGGANWDGIVHLPSRDPVEASARYFVAQICGDTRSYDFSPGLDRIGLTPGDGDHAIHELLDSAFVPQTWAIRPDAQHAKSETYRVSFVNPRDQRGG